MKSWIAMLLGLVMVSACQGDGSIGPKEQLYKRWNLNRVRNAQESTWVSYDTDAYYDTEYKADGSLVYRRNGVEIPTPCCSGNRFIRDGVMLVYGQYPSCPNVSCVDNSKATITILRNDLLELQSGERVMQYTPTN